MNNPESQPEVDNSKNSLTLQSLLASLSDVQSVDETANLELIDLPMGEILFEQGDVGHSVYLLVAGVLGVKVRHEDGSETVIDKLAPGALVGEMALISGRPRTATVYSIVDCGLLRITRSQFEEMVAQDKAGASALSEALTPRWQRLQLAAVLRDLFGEIDTPTLHALQGKLEWRHLSNGDLLFEQGDKADGMYIVINGRLRIVHSDSEGRSHTLNEIASGETVGEYALLTEEKRSATVLAIRETDVVRIDPGDFEQLVKQYPMLIRAVTRIIVERQQRQLKRTSKSKTAASNFAVVLASPDIDGHAFAAELSDKLNNFGNTFYLTAAKFDELYGQSGAAQLPVDDPSDPAIVAWLAEQDAKYQHVLFVCDYQWSEWTSRCLSQADRVLIVADPSGDPSLGAVENQLGQLKAHLRSDLIFLHSVETERPKGTASWLEEREVVECFHIRPELISDWGKLARLLTGRANALVLSGGGARGFAHLGVYRALNEMAIPIDYVGGVSIGALVSLTIATGMPYERAAALANQFAGSSGWTDYTLPLTSLMASKKVTTTVQDVCGDIQLEDTWLPYFCISTNLTTAEQVVHRRGTAWRAVRASLAIPGVFTPVIEDDEVLVDGGVMDNFPVDVMAKLSDSIHIIGVTLSTHQIRKVNYDFDAHISGWKILRSRLNPFSNRLRSPSLVGTILRTLDINSVNRSRETALMADLIIRPEVRKWGFLDFASYKEIEQAGYEAAYDLLQDWPDNG
jgi:NTE family protein/lysophospholipid hydrolase